MNEKNRTHLLRSCAVTALLNELPFEGRRAGTPPQTKRVWAIPIVRLAPTQSRRTGAGVCMLERPEDRSIETLRQRSYSVQMFSSLSRLAAMDSSTGLVPLIHAPPSRRRSSGKGPESKTSVTTVAWSPSGVRM